MLSKTQTDRLGDRLKQERFSDADLRLLDDYRRSFAEPYDLVVGRIRTKVGLEVTGRPAKTTTSIAEKLRREHIRLTQIQDIAGCRLVVQGLAEQERNMSVLSNLFAETTVIDRRERPSHGYRAVHVVVRTLNRTVEIQLRTELQHKWAELSEKLSDLFGPNIKYGGGDDRVKELLEAASLLVTKQEKNESVLWRAENSLTLLEKRKLTDEDFNNVRDLKQEVARLRDQMVEFRRERLEVFKESLAILEELEADRS